VVTGVSSGVVDQDRVVSVVYTLTENRIEQVAHQIDGSGIDSPQITTYLTAHDSGITPPVDGDLSVANGLVRRIVYPDEETSIDDHSVVFAYDRLGQVRWTRDQNGTEHEFTRDVLGRVTRDSATVASGSPIDDAVDAIEYEYDDLGRLILVESLSGSGSGSTVVNAVGFAYTVLGQLEQIRRAAPFRCSTPKGWWNVATGEAAKRERSDPPLNPWRGRAKVLSTPAGVEETPGVAIELCRYERMPR